VVLIADSPLMASRIIKTGKLSECTADSSCLLMVVLIKPDPEVVCASDVTSAGNTRLIYWMYRLTLPASSETKSRTKSGIQSQCLCNTFKVYSSLCLLTAYPRDPENIRNTQ